MTALLPPRPYAIWLATLLLAGVLPAAAWPGLAVGTLGMAALWRTRYQNMFIWFAVFPGLYGFWGIDGSLASLQASFALWGQVWAALTLWGIVASAMHENRRWAALWLGPAWLLQPSGLLLSVWILAHGLYTLETEQARAGQLGRVVGLTPRGTWGWLLAWGMVAVLAALAPLPSWSLFNQPSPPVVSPAASPPKDSPIASPGGEAPTSAQPGTITVREAAQTPFTRWATPLFAALQNLSGLLLLGVALLLLLLAWRSPGRLGRLRQSSWVPLLVVALTWLLLGGWFAVNQNRSQDTAAGQPPGLPPPLTATPGPPPQIERVASNYDWAVGLNLLFMVLWVAGSFALLYGVWRLWKWREAGPADPSAGRPGQGTPLTSLLPTDTLRKLYAWWLAQMQRRGQGRHYWESPREYAQRLAQNWPAVGPYLEQLTLRYQQVRYGGQADTAADPATQQATQQIIEQTRSPEP
jgi:hypothetical protein